MDDPLPESLLMSILFLSEEFYFLIFSSVAIVILFIGSAMVSGSEVAYFSISLDQLGEDTEITPTVRKKISTLLAQPKRLLATILILNNFFNIKIVILSAYLAEQLFGDAMSDASLIAIMTIGITFLMVFLGEIVPKVYANQNNIAFSKKTLNLLSFSFQFLKPLAWLLVRVSRVIENRIEKKGYNVSVDDLNEALDMATEEEATEEEKGILKGIVNFGTLSVKQIMKSRMDIMAIDLDTDFHELMNQINKTGYSRIPVFKETIDKIEGILYIKDLLPYVDEGDAFKWQELLRPIIFVPETKKIDTLFKDFQEKRIHIAIVVDEYGGTSGVITMEDVIEEIVGEINDEFDEDLDVAYNKLDENTYVFEGKVSLVDFCKLTGVDHKIFDEVKGESESLGGLLLEINAKLPNTGEKIRFDDFLFTVVAVNEKRIIKIRVYISR